MTQPPSWQKGPTPDEDEPDAAPKKITHIDYHEKRPGKADIFLDGKKAFSMNAFDAALLERGSIMDPAEVKKRAMADEKQRCWASALRLLGVRPQSRMELKRRLLQKNFSTEATAQALTRAEETGYINDATFAKDWIASRMRNQPKGRYMLRQELKQKGIDEAIIEALLMEEIDEVGAALTLIRKKAWKWEKLEPRIVKQKAFAFLAGKGFSFDVSAEAMDRFLSDSEG